MYFKGLFFFALLQLAPNLAAREAATPVVMELKPNKCVALHKSRQCYAQVKLQWQAEVEGNYCLFDTLSGTQLSCWQSKKKAKFEFEFASTKSVKFELRNMRSGAKVASADISVSWLYNSSNKRRRWRLF